MKLNIKYSGFASNDQLDGWIEDQMLPLEARLLVEEASVTLSVDRDKSPPFQIGIAVVTPGPDLLVEASGHTIRAAFTAALVSLHRNLDRRDRNRIRRKRDVARPLALRSALPARAGIAAR